MKYVRVQEEELKNKVTHDFFAPFDCTKVIEKIDFAVKGHTAVPVGRCWFVIRRNRALRGPKVRVAPRPGTRAEFTSKRTGGLGGISSGEDEQTGGAGALPEAGMY